MPTLDELTDALDRTCADVLGDTIQYAADGVTFEGVQAFVDYRDEVKTLDGVASVSQNILVTGLLKADIATKPTSTVRVRLARRAGKTFKPINGATDESGTGWVFELVEVPGG